jgi:hypothetical protein
MAEEKGLAEQEVIVEENDELLPVDKRLDGKWSIQRVWNDILTFNMRDRKMEPREHIWASEIGKNHYERYLKMKAVPYDIQYKERVLRKFAAGNHFENHLGYFLALAGVLKAHNERLEIPETKDHLKITGKLDFLAGGKIKPWADVMKDPQVELFFLFNPDYRPIAEALYKHCYDDLGGEVPLLVYEIKSVNSQVFWSKRQYLADAYRHHQKQLYFYLKAKNLPEGRMLYISKDDLSVLEFPVYLNDEKLKDEWEKDVVLMSDYIRTNTEPPKPDDILFDPTKKVSFQRDKKKFDTKGAWVKNWEVEWSPYLPTITGCANVEEWEAKIKPLMSDKNDELKALKLQELIRDGILTPDEKLVATLTQKKKRLTGMEKAVAELKEIL